MLLIAFLLKATPYLYDSSIERHLIDIDFLYR